MVIVIGILYSCGNEEISGPDNNSYFLKHYSDSGRGVFSHLFALEKDTVFIVGSDNRSMIFKKIGPHGHVQWGSQYSLSEDVYVNTTQFADGTIIANNSRSPDIMAFSPNGEILFEGRMGPSLYSGEYSKVIRDSEGINYCSFSDGGRNGGASTNYVIEIGPNGIMQDKVQYDLSSIGKITLFNIYRKEKSATWVVGNIYPRPSWNWPDPVKLYVAMIGPNKDILHIEVLDEFIDIQHSHLTDYIVGENGDMTCLTSPYNRYWNFKSEVIRNFEVFYFDNKQDLIWRKKIEIGARKVIPERLRRTADGGYLITGTCTEDLLSMESGFLVRLDAQGNVLQNKIIHIGFNSSFTDVLEYPNGDYLFSGHSKGFNNALDQTDPILLKVNSRFELK